MTQEMFPVLSPILSVQRLLNKPRLGCRECVHLIAQLSLLGMSPGQGAVLPSSYFVAFLPPYSLKAPQSNLS